MSDALDIHYMQHALRLAQRGLGQTWPNPSVGAVIVKDNEVLGYGVTARSGRPHAETLALAEAGENARGATLYVSLEPCVHQGQTPPCTKAIIDAGIKRVVAACEDPNPQVAGKGFAQLRAAGIEVLTGVCEAQAHALNEGFFSLIKRKRPFVALKLATSLDGKVATSAGESKWITSEHARQKGQALRGIYDAILTGIHTVLADDPELTCRLPGRQTNSPQRVVMDGRLRIPIDAKALPAWIFTSEAGVEEHGEKMRALAEKEATVFTVPIKSGHLSITAVMDKLAQKGVTRLLVETGGTLATAFLHEGVVDRLYWFRAPLVIGEHGAGVIRAFDMPLKELPRYALAGIERLGDDVLEIYDLKAT